MEEQCPFKALVVGSNPTQPISFLEESITMLNYLLLALALNSSVYKPQIQINSSIPKQIQVDEEFEITPEWLELCLEKNKL